MYSMKIKKCGTRNMVTANKLIGSNGVAAKTAIFIGFTKYSTHTTDTESRSTMCLRHFAEVKSEFCCCCCSMSRLFTWKQFNDAFRTSMKKTK